MRENVFKALLTGALTGVGIYFRQLLFPAAALLAVMALDYVTGMADAWVSRTLSSGAGLVGIVKKLGYLAAVAVAVVVDYIIQSVAARAGLDLGGFYAAFGLLVTIWLILNECISILENLSSLGVPLPKFLISIVARLKKTTETKGENSDESGG